MCFHKGKRGIGTASGWLQWLVRPLARSLCCLNGLVASQPVFQTPHIGCSLNLRKALMLAGAVPSESLFVANILADAAQTRLQVRRPSRSYREPREIDEKPVHLRLGEICVLPTKALGRLCAAP